MLFVRRNELRPSRFRYCALFISLFVTVGALWAEQKPTSTTPESSPSANSTKTSIQETPNNQGNSSDQELPSLPGAKTVFVPEGTKIAERKNMDYEDWSKPELTAGMKTEIAPLGKTEEGGIIREFLTVQWRELDPIDLWVVKPAGVKNPPVIIYLYSFPTSYDRFKDLAFCQFLTRNGFAAIGFPAAVTGQRLHDRPRKDWFVSQLQEAMGTTVHDVQMVLNYLSSRGDLDMNRVGIWGDGSGSSVAIMASAVDDRIKVLDLLDPWGDWAEWLEKSSLVPDAQRADLLKPDFLKSLENLEPLKLFPEVKAKQIRLQQIQEGVTVTPETVRAKIKAAAPARVALVQYQNRNAFLTEVANKGTGFDWIKGQLGSMILFHNEPGQNLTRVRTQQEQQK